MLPCFASLAASGAYGYACAPPPFYVRYIAFPSQPLTRRITLRQSSGHKLTRQPLTRTVTQLPYSFWRAARSVALYSAPWIRRPYFDLNGIASRNARKRCRYGGFNRSAAMQQLCSFSTTKQPFVGALFV